MGTGVGVAPDRWAKFGTFVIVCKCDQNQALQKSLQWTLAMLALAFQCRLAAWQAMQALIRILHFLHIAGL